MGVQLFADAYEILRAHRKGEHAQGIATPAGEFWNGVTVSGYTVHQSPRTGNVVHCSALWFKLHSMNLRAFHVLPADASNRQRRKVRNAWQRRMTWLFGTTKHDWRSEGAA